MTMSLGNELALTRAAHVAAVVLWIGGVAFVTTVLLPAVRRGQPPSLRLATFLRVEGGFAWQARVTVLIAGASGYWLVHRLQLWDRFALAEYWWMHAMVAVWAVFALMLFVIEPLFLHRALERARRPELVFRAMEILHWLLLTVSLVTVAGAVAGSHGLS